MPSAASRLKAVKSGVNLSTKLLDKLTPHTAATLPVTILVRRLYRLWMRQVKMHPKRFYRDHNFSRLLKVAARTLIFIAEHDDHYAGWLANTMLHIYYLVHETRDQFPPGAKGDVAWVEWASRAVVTKAVTVDE